MLLLWLYLGLCFGETVGAVPALEAVLLLTKDGLRALLNEQNEPALTAAAIALWENEVIGAYLMDQEFTDVLAALGLGVMAIFALKSRDSIS